MIQKFERNSSIKSRTLDFIHRISGIVDRVLAVIRNVRRYLRYEIKGIKHLKISISSVLQSIVAGFGKSTAFGMLGLVDDVVGFRTFHLE